MSIFAERIKELRTSLGLSQERFGTIVGVLQQTVHGWEKDRTKPDFETLRKICTVFGVSADSLIGIGPAPEPTVPHPEAFQMMRAQGVRIASAREAAGMSVKHVAAAIGITEEEYVRLEAGTQTEYDTGTIPALSELFGVSQTYILLGVDRPHPKPPVKKRPKKSKLLLEDRRGNMLEKDLTDAQFEALRDAINKFSYNEEPKQ